MLVSATMRGPLSAAAELLDDALHVRLFHAEFSGPAGAIALEHTPASLLAVASERLSKDLCLGAAFLLGQAFRFSDQIRGKRERAETCRGHSLFLD